LKIAVKVLQNSKVKLLFLIVLFSAKVSFAQFENTDIGARAIGLNGAFTSLADNSLAVFYNPAGLGQLRYREMSVFYAPSQFGISDISTGAFTFVEPISQIGVNLGIGVKTYGFELYRETNIILSAGSSFRNKIFYGANFNFYHLNIQNYNSASTFGVDIGGMAYLTDFLKWGFVAKNVSGAKIGESKEKLAQVYRTGLTYKPRDDINFIIEAEKDVKFPVSIRGGLEYFINDYVDMRVGVGSEPTTFSGGIGFVYNLFQVDYAIYNSQDIGITHQGSVSINFGGQAARKYAREQLRDAFK
jgi:hypothetical protein